METLVLSVTDGGSSPDQRLIPAAGLSEAGGGLRKLMDPLAHVKTPG